MQTQPEVEEIDEVTTNQLTLEMERALVEFEGTNPLKRPGIPKVGSSRKLIQIMGVMNRVVLPTLVSEVQDFTDFQTLIYCAAVAIIRTMDMRLIVATPRRGNRTPKKTAWEERLIIRIDTLRRDIGRMTQYMNGNRSRKIVKAVEEIMKSNQHHAEHSQPNTTALHGLDTLKQKLTVYSTRLARSRESNKRKSDSKLFQENERKFYRQLKCSPQFGTYELPTMAEFTDFWGQQLTSQTIAEEMERNGDVEQMPPVNFTMEEVGRVVKKLHNWNAPGPDKIQNYWLKKFTSTHGKLASLVNDVIQNPEMLPDFLMTGTTFLLPKGHNNQRNPAKYDQSRVSVPSINSSAPVSRKKSTNIAKTTTSSQSNKKDASEEKT